MLVSFSIFYTYSYLYFYTQDGPVPSSRHVVQAVNVPSSYCVAVMVRLLHDGRLKLSRRLSRRLLV